MPEIPPLVAVNGSRLFVERGGYRIEATTSGASLLVLPLEYSACLRPDLVTTGTTPPRLLRANLAMAGLLFTGHVKGRITLHYGPFYSACRIRDWDEADALHLGNAREWPVGPFENASSPPGRVRQRLD